MAQHRLRAWDWESPMNFHCQYQHLCRGEQEEARRELMFEKPLTPSDVGKLNRLVIPKQHAEKYFPLDGDSGEKGLLLSFEDESGKAWQFRYSYWNSSQSYVLTKGWSRFVKEKRLDAGDVVQFERLRVGGERLYIGCRHRSSPPPPAAVPWNTSHYASSSSVRQEYSSSLRAGSPLDRSFEFLINRSSLRLRLFAAADQRDEIAEDKSTETAAPANSKRLRLFGVNFDY